MSGGGVMRALLLAATATAAVAGGAASAGTLTLDFVETSFLCFPVLSDGTCSDYGGFSSPMTFVFDVSLFSPNFYYSEIGDLSIPEIDTDNPFGALLVSRPDGHLGGYYVFDYEVAVSPAGASVLGHMADGDDALVFNPDYVSEDHNQGLYWFQGFGYWTASYLPNGPEDGDQFFIAPVPLPASLPLLAGAIGILAWRRIQFRKSPDSPA
jgi:hypothetical protein